MNLMLLLRAKLVFIQLKSGDSIDNKAQETNHTRIVQEGEEELRFPILSTWNWHLDLRIVSSTSARAPFSAYL